MPDLLIELFSEEIPARMQARAAEKQLNSMMALAEQDPELAKMRAENYWVQCTSDCKERRKEQINDVMDILDKNESDEATKKRAPMAAAPRTFSAARAKTPANFP